MNNNDFKAVCFGEVLWDFLPDGTKLPGGAPMNVAYHLNQLGVPTAMISRIGNDELGKELTNYFTSKNVSGDFIQHDNEHETSRVLAKVEGNHVTYDIVKPVAWDFIQYSLELQQLVGRAPRFIFGSLGARNNTSRQTLFELLESANEKILDINLRNPHFEQKTLEYLMQHADVLKLNEDELGLLAGWYNFKGGERDQVKALQEKFKLHTVINTRGSKGALVLRENVWAEHPGFTVKVADTIGSGDAFLAGFLTSSSAGKSLEDATEFACAMGAFIASHHGACPSYVANDVNARLSGWKAAGSRL